LFAAAEPPYSEPPHSRRQALDASNEKLVDLFGNMTIAVGWGRRDQPLISRVVEKRTHGFDNSLRICSPRRAVPANRFRTP
jgi:hypothetical protein